MSRNGFTLRELLVVIAIVIVLLALLMPTLHVNQTPPGRMQCGNNVKQLSLGLQNYADTFGCFPSGAQVRTSSEFGQPSWGSSWLVATLPYCEQRPLHDKFVGAETRNNSDYASAGTRLIANGANIKYLFCPSSKLQTMQKFGGVQLIVPSYAGIMGANIDARPAPNNAADPLRRIVAAPYGGVAAGNGMLPLNEWLTFAACTDGSANVLLVGEVSDWYYDDAGKKLNPSLSIANAGDGPSNAAGWIAGTNLPFKIDSATSPPIPANSVCNLITLEHPVGINNQKGINDSHPNWGTRGIGRAGLNNPLLSAHPAGAMVGFVDGHVQLLTKQTDLYVIKRLAIRDDGAAIPAEDY